MDKDKCTKNVIKMMITVIIVNDDGIGHMKI